MVLVTTLGPSDWTAALHDCEDPAMVAARVASAALLHLPVDAACVHRHGRGREAPMRLGARRTSAADPGSGGGVHVLLPGELRALPASGRPSADYLGTVLLDLASGSAGGTHLELYTVEPLDLRRHEARLRAFGSVAGIAMHRAEQAAHLRRALLTRTEIGQAQGIVMERYGLDAEGAMRLLRRVSQHGNVPLVDVARELLTGPQRTSPSSGEVASPSTA